MIDIPVKYTQTTRVRQMLYGSTVSQGAIQRYAKIMTTISSTLIHPNVEVPMHNVNDRGYHKM